MALLLGKIFGPRALKEDAPATPSIGRGREDNAIILKQDMAAGRIKADSEDHERMTNNRPARYEYFLLGDTRPVRIAYSERGFKMGAETPDRETGELKIEHTLMSRIEQSWEVEEIDAETFEKLCRAYPETMRARLAGRAPKPEQG